MTETNKTWEQRTRNPAAWQTETFVIHGQLCETANSEDADLLGITYIDNYDQPTTNILAEECGCWRSTETTVRYFVTDREVSKAELEEDLVRVVTGAGESKYCMYYSEYTGYLWTDEKLKVGGHDLMEELRGMMGKWLWMEVVYLVRR